MGVNSLPKTVAQPRRDCDLNPGPSAPEPSTLTTRLRHYCVKFRVLLQSHRKLFAIGFFLQRHVKIQRTVTLKMA